MSRRVLAILAVVVVASLAAAGLAMVRSRPTGADHVRSLLAKLRKLDTVSLSMRSSLTSAGGAAKYTDSSAILDQHDDLAYVTLPEVISGGPLQLIAQGLTMYVSIPAGHANQFGAVRWVRVDTAGRADARGATFGPIPDPSTVMLSLAGAAGPVHHLGKRTLDGQRYDVLRLRVEPKQLAAHVTKDDGASANKLGGLSLRWSADVWVDGKDLVHRVELSTPVRAKGGPAETLRLDLRLGAFGDPVNIGVPPANAVTSVGTIAEALELVGVTT